MVEKNLNSSNEGCDDTLHLIEEGGLTPEHEDLLIRTLHRVIRFTVRILAVLMAFVILWSTLDVVWVIYKQLKSPPFMLLNISDILEVFGAFLVTLIAIEIFMNITLYLRDDVIHVKLVIETALMAIARKVIIFDYKTLGFEYILATSAVLIALGITYWLIRKKR